MKGVVSSVFCFATPCTQEGAPLVQNLGPHPLGIKGPPFVTLKMHPYCR